MTLGPVEIIAALVGSLFSSWWLILMRFGRALETKEVEIEEIEDISEDKRTPEQKAKLSKWKKQQRLFQKYRYRILAGMGGGVITSILFLGTFLKDASPEVTIGGALVTGMVAGLAGTAASTTNIPSDN